MPVLRACPLLLQVEQAQLVSSELIRVAILWHEQWHEGALHVTKCLAVTWPDARRLQLTMEL